MMRNAPMFKRFDPKNKQRHVGIGPDPTPDPLAFLVHRPPGSVLPHSSLAPLTTPRTHLVLPPSLTCRPLLPSPGMGTIREGILGPQGYQGGGKGGR